MSNILQDLTPQFAAHLGEVEVTYLEPNPLTGNQPFILVLSDNLKVMVGRQTADEWGYALVRNLDKSGDGFLQRDGSFDVAYGSNMDRYFNLQRPEDVEKLLDLLKDLTTNREAKLTELSEAYEARQKIQAALLPLGSIPQGTTPEGTA